MWISCFKFSKGEIWTCWPSLSQSWQRRRSIHKSGRWKLNWTSSVYLSYSLKLSSSLLNPGEEEGGDGDGPPAPWRESGLLRCARTHRLSRLKAQDCSGVEGKADIQGDLAQNLNKTGSKINTNWKSVESEAKWERGQIVIVRLFRWWTLMVSTLETTEDHCLVRMYRNLYPMLLLGPESVGQEMEWINR